MSRLGIRGLQVDLGERTVLDGVDLEVESGTLAAILGPSGCGKTTLLRAVAGFVTPRRGTIRLGGRVLVGPGHVLAPEARGVALVPQEGALFPHLDIAANIAFGLPRRERRSSRVSELLDLVGLAGSAQARPHELSGGQQHRVALARALAPAPGMVLLDEPFAALDATLRGNLRAEVRSALAAAGATAPLVTAPLWMPAPALSPSCKAVESPCTTVQFVRMKHPQISGPRVSSASWSSCLGISSPVGPTARWGRWTWCRNQGFARARSRLDCGPNNSASAAVALRGSGARRG